VGTVEGKVTTLEGQMLDAENKLDTLGTASTKNSTSIVTESSDLVESGAVYTALQSKADNSVIGTVEDGTNPTKAYAVGEHFIRNGKFCTVTVAVTTSSTWTLGSNYVEGDVADELTYNESSISISDNELFSSLPTNIVCKSGNIKQIVFHGVINTGKTVSAWSSFGTIPSGYRPKTAQFLYARLTKSNSDIHFARLQIGTNGTVSPDEELEAGDRLIVNATYIL
jgi:hypothetical protein